MNEPPVEPQPVSWQEVDAWFREFWPNRDEAAYPRPADCQIVATAIETVFHGQKKAQKEKSILGKEFLARAKYLLKNAPTYRAVIEKRTGGYRLDNCDYFHLDAARRLEVAERALRDLVVSCTAIQPGNPGRFLAEKIRQAWWQHAGTDLALGDESPPLLAIVQAAMDRLGLNKQQTTVAEALRGRSKRRRSGKPRRAG